MKVEILVDYCKVKRGYGEGGGAFFKLRPEPMENRGEALRWSGTDRSWLHSQRKEDSRTEAQTNAIVVNEQWSVKLAAQFP